MGWRPFIRLEFAKIESHWWIDSAEGFRIRQWVTMQTVEDRDGSKLLFITLGPILLYIAGNP